jgi:hypothetical protein
MVMSTGAEEREGFVTRRKVSPGLLDVGMLQLTILLAVSWLPWTVSRFTGGAQRAEVGEAPPPSKPVVLDGEVSAAGVLTGDFFAEKTLIGN